MLFHQKDEATQLKSLLGIYSQNASPKVLRQILELFITIPLYQTTQNPEMCPDGFPYFDLSIYGDNSKRVGLPEIAIGAVNAGCGVTINKRAGSVDWVFSLGDLTPLAKSGVLVSHQADTARKTIRIDRETKVQVGEPSEDIIPGVVRQHLRNYIETNLNFPNPKFYLMFNPVDNPPWTMIFNLSRKDFKNDTDYDQAFHNLSWFLPKTVFVGSIENDTTRFYEI